jgi:hypothetical protein
MGHWFPVLTREVRGLTIFTTTLETSRAAKIQVYKTLIRHVATYGAETWTLTVTEDNTLRMSERKIIRRIYGPVMENKVWRIRYNEELNTLLKGEYIVRCIESQRIRCLGHVERMEDNAMPKRTLKGRLYSKRRKGRLRIRWLEDVESDLKKMEVKGWKEKMRDREQWGLVVEEAKAHPGLQCRVAGRQADRSLAFLICSTTKRIFLGWVKEVRTTKS